MHNCEYSKSSFFDRAMVIKNLNFLDFVESPLKWRISSCLDIRIPKIQKFTDLDAKYAKL